MRQTCRLSLMLSTESDLGLMLSRIPLSWQGTEAESLFPGNLLTTGVGSSRCLQLSGL